MTQDLHLLMTVAVLGGRHGVEQDFGAIYDTWTHCYPDDALGAIGQGLILIQRGEQEDGMDLIRAAAQSASTRADQAAEVLASLEADIAASATEDA